MKNNVKNKIENVAVVLVETAGTNTELELYEIEQLVKTAQGNVAKVFSQKRISLDISTVMGEGKLDEIADYVNNKENNIDVLLFCNTLTVSQRTKIGEKINDALIIDKTDLILDIFALHAQSATGKKQVEMAQLAYSLANHTSNGNYSRQGAGIGTRGPGETKLETNKRVIRDRIVRIKRELQQLEKQRLQTKMSRRKNNAFTVSLVGYTNAGKSTLFNTLTNNTIYTDDKLFATLDTTTRRCCLPSGIEILLSDTVGFIRNLPHELVEAFKSTLEETTDADLVLDVCDVSDKNVAEQIKVTEEVLQSLAVSAPIVRVFNKCDKQIGGELPTGGTQSVMISAKTGKNIDVLLDIINGYVMKEYVKVNMQVPLKNVGGELAKLNNYCVKIEVAYSEEYAKIIATMRRSYLHMFTEYLIF